MNNRYSVVPFHPCNDADRAAGVIAGWDICDHSDNDVRVENFDSKDEADARCAEMNEAHRQSVLAS